MSDQPKKLGKPFEPGKSGNPGGKSKEREELRRHMASYVASFCKEHVDGIRKLAKSAASEKVQFAAHVWMAEQTLGKATQAITGADGGPIQTLDLSKLTVEELERLEQISRKVIGEGGE